MPYNKEHKRQYYLKNRSEILRKLKIYKEENRDKLNKKRNKANWDKKYRENNKEKYLVYNRDYYNKNRRRILDRQKTYIKRKYKHNVVSQREWRKQNYDRYYEYNVKRRSKIKQTPKWYVKDICVVFYWMMRNMTKIMNEKYHVDHIIPISKGGLHSQENLQVMRAIDNLKKSNKIIGRAEIPPSVVH